MTPATISTAAGAEPRRRVYILSHELVERIRDRQASGGHLSEVDTVRFLLTDALARWEERTALSRARSADPAGGARG